ncbi:DNA translocase FtsK [Microvirga alba]|uniref:DNA translocase FtsK n=1 Tax=Microvirga alba TaxID=2791025 RepID=UPI001E31D768|nr:DNA translocase FtsK [Microvirga alba]
MRNSFQLNDFLPATVQSEAKAFETSREVQNRGDSDGRRGIEFAWETPWSSAGETEPGWWRAFALDKGVRATRTPDRFIKRQPETNVVALAAGEATDAARLARAADRSCEDAIRKRLERLRAAVESRATPFESRAEPSPVATPASVILREGEVEEPNLPPGVTENAKAGIASPPEEVTVVDEISETPDMEAAHDGIAAPDAEIPPAIEEVACEIPAELMLPAPAMPAFSAFAFHSSLYRFAVSLKPEPMLDVPEDRPPAEEPTKAGAEAEPEAGFGQPEAIAGDTPDWVEPEEAIASGEMVSEADTAEGFDAGYLALFGEEIAPFRTSLKDAAAAQPSILPRASVDCVLLETPALVGHIPTARVTDFPLPEQARGVGYELPAIELLAEPPEREGLILTEEILEERAGKVEKVIRDFGVKGEVIHVHPGPVVTLYELEPAPGTKSSRVIALSEDIARSMSATSARVAVIPGRNAIGIELPNETRETVYLRELLETEDFKASTQKLPICLGKTIGGEPVIADLARMPHLLVAGTTGSGKSVAINTMILSLLYRFTPERCRLIMVDPKMLELSVYDGIPHLLTPVVTDPKKAIIALRWAVREMEDRYRKMSKLGVRNIDGFNARVSEAKSRGEVITRTVQTGFDKTSGEAVYEDEVMDLNPLPFIVVIVDEMADLMMVAGKEIEGAIQRLAQMARAAGIHVILATQRPSVDVITGTIKANFPTRISFQVTSKIDSRTILGEMGAEQLLGQGDMLYMAGGGRITRVHGPFCSDEEVEKVVNHLKRQGEPVYLEAVTADDEEPEEMEMSDLPAEDDDLGLASTDLYEQAVSIVLRHRKASTSYIQRRLQIGYNRAASMMERMEKEGVVGPSNHAGKREILRGEFED